MTPRVINEPHIDKRADQSIRRGLCVCFPADVEFYSKTRGWNQYEPHITTVLERVGRVIAHAAAIDKSIMVGTRSVRAAGIMNVFVLPDYRKKGLANLVVGAALAEAERQGFHIGLLFCKHWLERVYQTAGWQRIENRKITRVVAGKTRPLREHIISMYYPLNMKTLPSGDIDLQGNEW